MMTKEQYIESLRKLHLNLYMFGKKIENPVDDPVIRPSLNSFAATYELAEDPQYEDLMTATSHISGKKINRFTHMHQSTDDLIKKVKMQRLLGQKTAACFQRCVGMDAMNAVFSSTYEIDEACGTKYHENFLKFLTRVQDEDLAVDGAMTDVKGDRSLAPSKQADPDLFLHVVERTPDGVYVTGAKAHQTGFVNSHEVLVMPTISMREGDEDYAISFAVPTDAEGITLIYGRQSCDTRKLEEYNDIDVGNKVYGGHEVLVIFDRVFVPNDRIFLNGEVKFAGMIVERFAGYHRQSYGGCKVGVGDVLIGATALAGGLMVTQPSEADYRNPALKPYIEKYLKGVASVPTEDRMRLLRLIENMTMGTAAVGYLPESMHGAGSPQAQRIMIARQSNLEMKKELAKKIARIQ